MRHPLPDHDRQIDGVEGRHFLFIVGMLVQERAADVLVGIHLDRHRQRLPVDDVLLLIQRADSGVWLYPTGWADVGYSPSEVAVKEVREETGIICEVLRPLAIIDGLRAGFSRVPLYSLVFLCRAVGGEVSPHPQECLDAGWFSRDDLPSPLANFDIWGEDAFGAIEGTSTDVVYDRPRDPVWRGTTGENG